MEPLFRLCVAEDLHLSNPKVSVNDFELLLERCTVWEYEWGIIMALENDMHIHILSSYRKHVFLRKPLREVANIMFNEYDNIKTTVMKDKPSALAFDLRMGWELESETVTSWHLTMIKEGFKYGAH